VESPLVGRHNVDNILTAIGVGVGMGISGHAISNGIKNMRAVPGRMEKVDESQPFGVLVDYAHTEDALNRLLEATREIATGRIITVFGCGGDRDRSKRPAMGAAAVKGSDVVIVTSDNPRTEDPLSIIREIEAGMAGQGAKVADVNAAPAGKGGKKPRQRLSGWQGPEMWLCWPAKDTRTTRSSARRRSISTIARSFGRRSEKVLRNADCGMRDRIRLSTVPRIGRRRSETAIRN
jgi:hypothetical protein